MRININRRTPEVRPGNRFALFDGRYIGTPKRGLSLSDAGREVVLGWRLAEEMRTGLSVGLEIEGAWPESAQAEGAVGHRSGLDLGKRLEGGGAQAFEIRFEGLRLEPANAAEHRISSGPAGSSQLVEICR